MTIRATTHVYHLAEQANWASIQTLGLLSASLLTSIASDPRSRAAIETEHRDQNVHLPGGLLIRDQKPMPPAALRRCLVGMEPGDWYALLNSKVFFWFDTARLNRHRRAVLTRPQIVMRVELAALLHVHLACCAVTAFNTGNARRKPALRNHTSFVPYRDWMTSGWASESAGPATGKRPDSHSPVELAVAGAVPDIMDFVDGIIPLGAHEFYDA